MNPSIQIYTSYRKGLKTLQGSFPIFNNQALLGCVVPSTISDKKEKLLKELDEFTNTIYLITEDSDRYNETEILMYVGDIPLNLIF